MFPLSDSIKSPRFPYLNVLFILATVYVFYLQATSPDFEAFIYQYALVPSLVDFNNMQSLYPIITSMFLHGNLLHLVSNMWFLWVFGDNVETHVGAIFYPFLYFASGIAGGLAQYFFMTGSDIPMLGASGAVAGILGAYFVLFGHSRIKTLVPIFGFVTITDISAKFMLGYWFVLQIISGAVSLSAEGGGVAFWAHAGGFGAGWIIAKLFKPALHYEIERIR
jgi:membrane associated rhomboid family serine protease